LKAPISSKKAASNSLAMVRLSIKSPSVKVENLRVGPKPIDGVSTGTAAFLGETQTGPDAPTLVTGWLQFQSVFGGYFGADKYLPYTVEGFFANGGQRCYICKVKSGDYSTVLAKTEAIDDISLIYAPNAQATAGFADLLIEHCERLRSRFAIFDSIKGQEPSAITKPRESSYAALYYPWVYVKVNANTKVMVPPGGHIAGVYTRVDNTKGVHKSPANEQVNGITGVEHSVSNLQVETLNSRGINCIRSFEGRGILVWGARTLSSDPQYKYISVRRLLIYLEQTIQRGTAWTVFEQDNEATWAKVKAQVEEFLMQTWKDGKLQGAKPEEAYFVKCDKTTMTQSDVDAGRLIVEVGVAAVMPAEFTVLRVSQTAVKA
jgi:Phage tail sheath protein FI